MYMKFQNVLNSQTIFKKELWGLAIPDFKLTTEPQQSKHCGTDIGETYTPMEQNWEIINKSMYLCPIDFQQRYQSHSKERMVSVTNDAKTGFHMQKKLSSTPTSRHTQKLTYCGSMP